MSSAAIAVTDLTRRYGGVRALDRVTLTLNQGEVLGLIGPNGAGKTTLIRCIAGFETPDEGQVEIADGRALRDALFYLPDAVTPYPELTVKRILSLFAAAFGAEAGAASRVQTALQLGPVAAKCAGALSKGYRRRLLLAIALLSYQPVLLLDEPFDGLDLHQVRAVADLLRTLTTQGRSLVVSVHQLTDAERVCDRFALLAEGRLLAQGSLDELRTRAGVERGGLEEVFLALTEPTLV
jgi:ABC-type multidrug transport system ATPase subunit